MDVEVGVHPNDVAVDPTTHKVYVVNHDDSTTSVIDGNTGRVLTTVKVGTIPFKVAVDERTHKVYVVNYDNTISLVAAVYGPAKGPLTDSVVYGPANDLLTDSAVYGPAKGSFTSSCTAKTPFIGKNPWSIAINSKTGKVYVSNEGSNSLSISAEPSC